jgi:hypothetical protein
LPHVVFDGQVHDEEPVSLADDSKQGDQGVLVVKIFKTEFACTDNHEGEESQRKKDKRDNVFSYKFTSLSVRELREIAIWAFFETF